MYGSQLHISEAKNANLVVHLTSLLATHLLDLSILVKTNFPLLERLTKLLIFPFFVYLSLVLVLFFWFQHSLFFFFHLVQSFCLIYGYFSSLFLVDIPPHLDLTQTRRKQQIIRMQRQT